MLSYGLAHDDAGKRKRLHGTDAPIEPIKKLALVPPELIES